MPRNFIVSGSECSLSISGRISDSDRARCSRSRNGPISQDILRRDTPDLRPDLAIQVAQTFEGELNLVIICPIEFVLYTPSSVSPDLDSWTWMIYRCDPTRVRRQTPMIMIGPGTGVAPFRAFLQEREYHLKRGRDVGQCHLFFGCRRRNEDFLYREELEAFAADGICELYTAFSREQANKVYVTDLLAEQKDLIWDILEKQEGSFYVCGEAGFMVPAVKQIVSTTLQEKGNMTSLEAEEYIKNLQANRRYCTDMWSL